MQDFGLADVPMALSEKVEDLAQKALLHDDVTWEDSVDGVTDHDAPACPDVLRMSDEDLCSYVDAAIKGSRK